MARVAGILPIAALLVAVLAQPSHAQDKPDKRPGSATDSPQPDRPTAIDVRWRVRRPDSSPWANTRFGPDFATDANGEFVERVPVPEDWFRHNGPRVAPIPIQRPTGPRVTVDLELGDESGIAVVNGETEWRFNWPHPTLEEQIVLGVPTGLDFEGFSGMPALMVRPLLVTDPGPGHSDARVQAQFATAFQVPLIGATWQGDWDAAYFWGAPIMDFGWEPGPPRKLDSWSRRALRGAQLCVAGQARMVMADNKAADSGRPLSAMVALKWIPSGGELMRGGAYGFDLSFTLPFDALRDQRGEDVDGIVDLSAQAGGLAVFFGTRGWLSIGRSFGPDAFTRLRLRIEIGVVISVGYDMELRWHDAQRLGGEARYGLLIGFGGLGHGISVLLDFRLGGDIGDAFRFGIGVPFV